MFFIDCLSQIFLLSFHRFSFVSEHTHDWNLTLPSGVHMSAVELFAPTPQKCLLLFCSYDIFEQFKLLTFAQIKQMPVPPPSFPNPNYRFLKRRINLLHAHYKEQAILPGSIFKNCKIRSHVSSLTNIKTYFNMVVVFNPPITGANLRLKDHKGRYAQHFQSIFARFAYNSSVCHIWCWLFRAKLGYFCIDVIENFNHHLS